MDTKPRQMILNTMPLFISHDLAPAIEAEIESAYLETPPALSASVVVGRVARVHSAANNVARGYHTDARTHDLMVEASAHAAACAYELAAVVRGDLHLRLERAAWHLERGAFSTTKEAAYSAWRAAMAELGAVQLTANAAVRAETKARGAA